MTTPLSIRRLEQADCATISRAFAAQGWDKPATQYESYFAQQEKGTHAILVAEWNGDFAGYCTIEWQSAYPYFREHNIPEITDLNVLIHLQRNGIATALLEHAEQQIGQVSGTVGIGVGLAADYGPAQILYARRGYIPNGRGIVSNYTYPKYGDSVRVDDDLVLYLTKQL